MWQAPANVPDDGGNDAECDQRIRRNVAFVGVQEERREQRQCREVLRDGGGQANKRKVVVCPHIHWRDRHQHRNIPIMKRTILLKLVKKGRFVNIIVGKGLLYVEQLAPAALGGGGRCRRAHLHGSLRQAARWALAAGIEPRAIAGAIVDARGDGRPAQRIPVAGQHGAQVAGGKVRGSARRSRARGVPSRHDARSTRGVSSDLLKSIHFGSRIARLRIAGE